MPLSVHFIWWGPNRNDDVATATPIQVKQQLGSAVDVKLWCYDTALADDAGLRAAGVEIRTVRQSTFGLGQRQQMTQAVMRAMHNFRAYVAVKDLMSLLILEAEGGVCLDTTTAPLPTIANLRNFLALPSTDPKVPILYAEGNTHQPLLMTESAILFGRDDNAEGEEIWGDMKLPVPGIDVWAMYSPAKHRFVQAAIDSYTARASRLGLVDPRPGRPLTLPTVSGGLAQQARYWVENYDPMRNEIIGQLMVRSVYDGLFAAMQPNEVPRAGETIVRRFGWPASRDSGSPAWILDALGIRKINRNTWRAAS
jgi:hypothetical protein